MSTDAYTAFRETEPCHRCGEGESWTVKGPDGACIGQSWTGDNAECDAEETAVALNAAFDLGRKPPEQALLVIVEVASGAKQVADDDTGGMQWIDKFARETLTALQRD